MIFRQFYDSDLAQGSYLIGCEQAGEAVIVDPRRDIAEYVEEARKRKLKITAVTETHIHADYLSGARELAEATGARLLLSDEGGPDWLYGFAHEGLKHQDVIRIGQVELTVLHTPGHTPEHVSFLVQDHATAQEPGFLLTGDFVFVGDVGRPDLLDEAAGYEDSRFEGARQLFASLRDRFLALPDFVQVWPGHGAGSACGKALGSVASTTVGYERRFAWWAGYLASGDEDGFIEELLSGQPDAPHYFGRMKRLNRAGPALLGELPLLPELAAADVADGAYRLIDTRAASAFNQGSAQGAVQIPAGGKFVTYASYVINPETDQEPLVLLAADAEHATRLRDGLLRIGVDDVAGFITSLADLPSSEAPLLAPADLEGLADMKVLDVRSRSEFDAGNIPGALQLHAGRVMSNLASLPQDRTIAVYCQSGARATLIASALREQGFDAREVDGNYPGWAMWQQARQPA